MKAFWQAFDRVIDFMAFLAGCLMAFITLSICYSVIMRYFFQRPPIWVVQTCEYALLWIVFLGTAWVLREKGHVAVDVLYSKLKENAKIWLTLCTFMGAMLACSIVSVIGFYHTWECFKKNIMDVRAITIPKYIVFVIIPIGMVTLVLQFLRMVSEQIYKLRNGV